MSRLKQNNQYEIQSVSSNLKVIKTFKPVCIEKVKKICEILSYSTNKPVYWFNNVNNEEIELYTENENLQKMKNILFHFEQDYRLILKKHNSIIKHRHRIL